MENFWITVIGSFGFPIALILLGLKYISKHTPAVLSAWNEFTNSLRELSASVAQSSEATAKNLAITQKHYDRYITVEDHLKKALEMLEEHHDNAVDIREDVGDVKMDVGKMSNLLIELAEQIQNLNENKGA